MIDYSCSPYQLSIEGIDSEYISVGCKMDRAGLFLHETPRLEVTMSSPNLKTLHRERPPFTIYLNDNSPVEFQVLNNHDQIMTIKISAKLPSKLHRLKTSIGFGPYTYKSVAINESINNQWAPSMMIYGKFDLNDTASIKAFDALLYSKTIFNNSGLYFSYDLAEAFDGRILLNALIGFQGLNYKYNSGSVSEFNFIYPQGFEIVYKHAFGVENQNLFYGMFLSTNSNEPYTNTWIRLGGKFFTELNYINWSKNDKRITMYGLSIGLPFFEAF